MSSEPSGARRTALYDEHVAAGARIVPFAGFLMPLQYSGVLEEHLAVRRKTGLFDVGHMGEIEARGPGALAFLQHVTPNDVARLVPGRVQYNALLTAGGCFVDDLLIYRMGEAEYLLVVNAANIEKDFGHLRARATGFDVELRNVSDAWGQVALQGPLSPGILQPLTTASLAAMSYYAFERVDVTGVACIVSRTGYTGEDGFEIYMPAEAARGIWRAILEAGSRAGIVPCGLGARDTLRLEARMLLYGNDMDETTTVLEADLGWIVKLGKGLFLGRELLERQKREGVARKLVGFEMEGRAIARHGYPAWADGRPVGQVTSGTFAPFLKKSIGLVYLPRGLWEPGTRFEVEVRGRREGAVVVPTPFYKRAR